MEADFTLVPHGGLGNRILAICSVITYCKQHNKSLKIIWFKDQGLNCSVKELMFINPEIENVEMYDAKFTDLILRDNPRRRNLWIPKFFQFFLFDRKIYPDELVQVLCYHTKSDFGDLDKYKHIFMVNWGCFWKEPEMWKAISVTSSIKGKVDEVLKLFNGTKRLIGIHIRQTDHVDAINASPIELFVNKIQEEIDLYKDTVRFYLASDSLHVKNEIVAKFGDKIITSMKQTSRNNKEGIIEAFVEMNVLAQTHKIYASYSSTFSLTAHYLSGNDFEVLVKTE